MLTGKYPDLYGKLTRQIDKKRIYHDPLYTLALGADASALLVETSANNLSDLNRQIGTILEMIRDIPVELPVSFTDIPDEYEIYWNIRKGLFPSVGAMRKNGTTVIIEDVVFPVHRLADESIDKCIECGFCEPSCVSAGLTLTPRQRIQKSRRRKITGTGGCTSESQQ